MAHGCDRSGAFERDTGSMRLTKVCVKTLSVPATQLLKIDVSLNIYVTEKM
jgi:hypothetical protein